MRLTENKKYRVVYGRLESRPSITEKVSTIINRRERDVWDSNWEISKIENAYAHILTTSNNLLINIYNEIDR